MNKAVFFDRDGTLIKEKEYLSDCSEIEIIDGTAEGIAHLNKLGYLVIMVTNQSGVARGYMTEKDVNKVNAALVRELSLRGARVDDTFYCPHFVNGIRTKYAVECNCRKPAPGMALKAKEKYDIDFSKSFVIGDKTSDMELARKIGAKAILVKTGYCENVDTNCCDYVTSDVFEASLLIADSDNHTKKKLNEKKEKRLCWQSRLEIAVDKGSFKEWKTECMFSNPFNLPNYEKKINDATSICKSDEAIIIGEATVQGERIAIGICDSRFLMATMGHNFGEKIKVIFDRAIKERLPVFLYCCSGGARLEEGLISLMQMEKTASLVKRHSDEGLFFAPILTDPTTGGVMASFAALGDIIIAEPNSNIGFAGRKVIKETIGEELPEHYQTSEFQLEHGMIDLISERESLRNLMWYLTKLHKKDVNLIPSVKNRVIKLNAYSERMSLNSWQQYQKIRSTTRPGAQKYIERLFDGFLELHGDRVNEDDKAIVGGIALFDNIPVTVIGNERGRSATECLERKYGMVSPSGYRKALRLMKSAEKFNRPVISFVNTPGAFCGARAEEEGQCSAIANLLYEASSLKVPVLAIIIGEAGSGGALATSVGNEVWLLENAKFSVISPEGYSCIRWKSASKKTDAVEEMDISGKELLRMGLVDKVIPEFGGASEENLQSICSVLKEEIRGFISTYSQLSEEEIVNRRLERYNRF